MSTARCWVPSRRWASRPGPARPSRSIHSTIRSRCSTMFKLRLLLSTATVLSSLALSRPGRAEGGVYPDPVPPIPSPAQVDEAAQTLGNPSNKPVTGAAEIPTVVGGQAPPSLEALQATRPGDQHGD